MLLSHIMAVTALTLLRSLSASAADVCLGPELSPSWDNRGKTFVHPQIVTVGSGAAAVWSDSGSLGVWASFGGGKVTIDETNSTTAWSGGMTRSTRPIVSVAQVGLDGTLLTPPHVVVPRTADESHPAAQIAWSGSEYVVVWTEALNHDSSRRAVRALRLDARLNPIDAQPIEAASAPSPISPWVIATPDGTAIAYSRFDDGEVASVRVRTLERLTPLSRRRAVGR